MFAPDNDYDPIPPSTGQLLTDLGIDVNAVRETLADDFLRRCADHEVPEDRSEGEAKEE